MQGLACTRRLALPDSLRLAVLQVPVTCHYLVNKMEQTRHNIQQEDLWIRYV